MASKQASINLGDGILERLDEESRRTGRSRSEVAETLIEEGLRMAAHPEIKFRSGGSGRRRPALLSGPDIWCVARVIRGTKGTPDRVLKQTVKLTGLRPDQVEVAMKYYAGYRDEIDEWLRDLDEYANRAEDDWRRERGLPPL